jgi:hypothetical protein
LRVSPPDDYVAVDDVSDAPQPIDRESIEFVFRVCEVLLDIADAQHYCEGVVASNEESGPVVSKLHGSGFHSPDSFRCGKGV